MTEILEVRNLRKNFGTLTAIDGINFTVKKGTCFGLLGPNGAGKTTTVEIMEGVTAASSGEVLFNGQPLNKTHREQIGIQFQMTALQDFLTVHEVLTLFRNLYKKNIDLESLKKKCALEEFWDRDNKKLSGGQRQRLLLAVALVNDPDIVFLDEPTTGLDPQARRNFWELVRDIKAQQKTVILTTHYMEEAYELCDEIVIMDKGKIIANGEPGKLLRKYFEGVLIQLPRDDFKQGKNLDSLNFTERDGFFEIRTTRVNETLQDLLNASVPLAGISIRSANLDDLFLALTGGAIRE